LFDLESCVKLGNLTEGLAERPDSIPLEFQLDLASRISRSYRLMKETQKNASDPYQPKGEWAAYVAERQEFYNLLTLGEPEPIVGKLRNFWRNELGPIVKEYAKFEDLQSSRSDCIRRFEHGVANNFAIWKEIVSLPAQELAIPWIGNPWGYIIDGQLVAPKATRFHHHAQQIRNLLSDVGHPIAAEIGAGYGGLAYYLLRDEPRLSYVDFDLPETLVLAAYYLICCFPDRKIFLYGDSQFTEFDQLAEYSAVLLPNYMLPSFPDNSVDLFLNTFSLSEMPWETVEEYLGQIERTTRHYFLHNNMDRTGVMNRGFERIPASAYPLNGSVFKLVYKHFDIFHGHFGDYREFLFQRARTNSC
jgi:hypothetical protein